MTTYCLILDQDPVHAQQLSEFCGKFGLQALITTSLPQAKAAFIEREVLVAFIDLHGGVDDDPNSGLLLLDQASEYGVEALCMSDHDNPRSADEAIRKGASYYFCKPFDPNVITPIFRDIVQESQQSADEDANHELCAVDQFGFLRGRSQSMRKLYRLLRKVSQTDASLMIIGESGTGKELVAQTVHTLSTRAAKPFVAVNCAAITQSLIASELFGHEKGSFSGAHARHKGFFEQAAGGTLFLDEITEMDVELQTKLLRVLETREFRRLGSEETFAVDVRVLSATNLSPELAIREGKLREDLYYRLAQFPVFVPPLRQRGDDIAGLAQYFLNALNEHHSTSIAFSSDVLELITRKAWPGNVRELKNYVERAYIMSDAIIEISDLPERDFPMSQQIPSGGTGERISLPTGISLAEAEKTLILAALERYEGDKKAVAEELGISLKTLYNRLRDYKSDAPVSGSAAED
ncbi:MAG: sigma-54 dependent transcriptional regulator [Halioglobus sp.]